MNPLILALFLMISAPHVSPPHISAPHLSAPHVPAPHVLAEPNIAPHVAAPHVEAPTVSTPRFAPPHTAAPAPHTAAPPHAWMVHPVHAAPGPVSGSESAADPDAPRPSFGTKLLAVLALVLGVAAVIAIILYALARSR